MPSPAGGYSTLHNSSPVLCKNDDGVDGDGDSGEIIDSDEDYHVYDNGYNNDGCSVDRSQINIIAGILKLFNPALVFSNRISFVDC